MDSPVETLEVNCRSIGSEYVRPTRAGISTTPRTYSNKRVKSAKQTVIARLYSTACVYCTQIFPTEDDKKMHQRSHYLSKYDKPHAVHFCGVCQEMCVSISRFLIHYRHNHSKGVRFTCLHEGCDNNYLNKKDVIYHHVRFHPLPVTEENITQIMGQESMAGEKPTTSGDQVQDSESFVKPAADKVQSQNSESMEDTLIGTSEVQKAGTPTPQLPDDTDGREVRRRRHTQNRKKVSQDNRSFTSTDENDGKADIKIQKRRRFRLKPRSVIGDTDESPRPSSDVNDSTEERARKEYVGAVKTDDDYQTTSKSMHCRGDESKLSSKNSTSGELYVIYAANMKKVSDTTYEADVLSQTTILDMGQNSDGNPGVTENIGTRVPGKERCEKKFMQCVKSYLSSLYYSRKRLAGKSNLALYRAIVRRALRPKKPVKRLYFIGGKKKENSTVTTAANPSILTVGSNVEAITARDNSQNINSALQSAASVPNETYKPGKSVGHFVYSQYPTCATPGPNSSISNYSVYQPLQQPQQHEQQLNEQQLQQHEMQQGNQQQQQHLQPLQQLQQQQPGQQQQLPAPCFTPQMYVIMTSTCPPQCYAGSSAVVYTPQGQYIGSGFLFVPPAPPLSVPSPVVYNPTTPSQSQQYGGMFNVNQFQ